VIRRGVLVGWPGCKWERALFVAVELGVMRTAIGFRRSREQVKFASKERFEVSKGIQIALPPLGTTSR
jgi:hypothetical protein